VARFGGEEFILLLPNSSCRDAFALANKLREKFQSTELTIRDSKKTLKVTVSFGVAMYRQGEPVADFIARADRALYLAKTSGRNRVIGEIELGTVA
jgi:diguanylate cyclase